MNSHLTTKPLNICRICWKRFKFERCRIEFRHISTQDSVYGAVLVCLMNVEKRQTAAGPQANPTDLAVVVFFWIAV